MTPTTYDPNPSTARWFARRVFDALWAVFYFTWWTAFGIVFVGFCLTTHH